MDKLTKAILWGTGILVALIIALTTYSIISGNYDIGGYFAAGVMITVFGIVIVASTIYYIIGVIKLNKRKKGIFQERVAKKAPLPIYSRNLYFGCIVFYVILTFLFVLLLKDFSSKLLIIYAVVSLISATIFYYKLRQKKVLYLYKENTKVKNYYDNLENFEKLFLLFTYINHSGECFIRDKCEYIELYNSIELWSCFSKDESHMHVSRYDSYNPTYYCCYIFSTIDFNSEKSIDIVLNNNSSTFLHHENIYISKYSNLPPFIIVGDVSKNICGEIDGICSDFFAKTRSKYVLTIQNGLIGLGLRKGRFGRFNRYFNQNKTIKETDEAINEIAEFLVQVKNIVEKY